MRLCLSLYSKFECVTPCPIDLHETHETLPSFPTRGSRGDGKLAGHNILDGGMDVGEVVERCEGNILLFAVCDEI
jgi:hypothetical protein